MITKPPPLRNHPPITSFREKYFFLSNFSPSQVLFENKVYVPTVEHAYQAYKAIDNEKLLIQILNAPTPSLAKKLSKQIESKPEWHFKKYKIMEDLLRQKFNIQILAQELVSTNDAELIEGNTWNDCDWGQCPIGFGQNNLGKLLMKIRGELQNGH